MSDRPFECRTAKSKMASARKLQKVMVQPVNLIFRSARKLIKFWRIFSFFSGFLKEDCYFEVVIRGILEKKLGEIGNVHEILREVGIFENIDYF